MRHRLLIPAAEADPRWLTWWEHLVPTPGPVMGLSFFADWFLLQDDGRVWRLDVLEGSFDSLGVTEPQFWSRLNREAAQDDWLQAGHVVSLEQRGLVLKSGQCYVYRLLPRLGGPITVDNMMVGDLAGWQLFTAQVHQQLDRVPKGGRVTRLECSPEGCIVVRWEKS